MQTCESGCDKEGCILFAHPRSHVGINHTVEGVLQVARVDALARVQLFPPNKNRFSIKKPCLEVLRLGVKKSCLCPGPH